MVGDQHDEQVFPRGRSLQTVDHLPHAVVRKGHCVQHPVIELRIGDVEGRMAAQRQQSREKRLAGFAQRDHAVGEPVAHQPIVVAPVRSRGVEAQVLLPDQLLPSRGVHVGGLVGEIEVAAVGETRLIPLSRERTRHRGQVAALGREFHNRHARLRRESAQNRHLAAVGAERIGEEILEPDALAFQPLHVGHDGFSVDLGVHHRPGEALQNDDHHIGPQRVEHPLGGTRCRTVAPQGVELRGPRLFVEEGVFAGIVGTVAETGQERENGVRGRMVQKRHGAEIDLRNIGHRGPQPAADRQEVESREHDDDETSGQGQPPADGTSVENAQDATVGPEHQRGIRGGQQRLPHAEPEIDARHRLLGIGEVDQHRRINAEPPMLVQRDVDGEDHGRHHGDQRKIGCQHAPPHPFRDTHPQREKHGQERQRGDITRDGHVERQPVPQHLHPAPETRPGRLCGIPRHKDGFLHGHREDGRTEHGNEESEFSAHYLFLFFDFRQGGFGHRAARDGWAVPKYAPIVTRKGCAEIAA